jgi:ABC-type Fe3+ transport system substrate-binding protein
MIALRQRTIETAFPIGVKTLHWACHRCLPGLNLFGLALQAIIMAMLIPSVEAETLTIISPHNEAIRYEIDQGFQRWNATNSAEPVQLDWRDHGGGTDALRFVLSEFASKPDGIGVDCFFGGGQEPCLFLTDKKLVEHYRPPNAILNGLPESIQGVTLYDPEHSWHAVVLASFGILQNTRMQTILHLPRALRWEDLARPVYAGTVGAADPRNSSTMNAMFESFLQAYGWEKGWQLLTAISGNVRKFDRISSYTAKDVTLGETAQAFAIDFYAFPQVAASGRDQMTYVLPDDFTVLTTDGVVILKGAPHLFAARRFVDFLLSDAGQKLWFLPVGHPEGPRKYSIERLPIRPALYQQYKQVSNIEYSPFDLHQTFVYNARLAQERRDVVAALVGTLLVDTHSELKATWESLRKNNKVDDYLKELGQMPLSADEAMALVRGPWKEAAFRNQKKIEWQTWAQNKYQRIRSQAQSHARPN